MRTSTIVYLSSIAALVATLSTTAVVEASLSAAGNNSPPQLAAVGSGSGGSSSSSSSAALLRMRRQMENSPYYAKKGNIKRKKGPSGEPSSAAAHNNGGDEEGDGDAPPNPRQPANPVIAMVASPMSDCTTDPNYQPPQGFGTPTGCIVDFYLRWLQPQGIRVVPMSHLWPDEKKKALLDKVNGVMLLGGGLDGDERKYYVGNVSYILDYALARPGFLLWGTCQGMQVLSILLNQDLSILTCDYVGTEPSMLPLDMTKYQTYSTLMGLAAERIGIVDDLQNYNTTLNWHHCGITPDNFQPKLAKAPVISTNVDVNGKPFVSAWEIVDGGKNIFAVQYHPERPATWFSNDIIGHDRKSIDVATYHARFVAQRLQLNDHSFPSQEEVNNATLENYPHFYTGWGAGFYWINI